MDKASQRASRGVEAPMTQANLFGQQRVLESPAAAVEALPFKRVRAPGLDFRGVQASSGVYGIHPYPAMLHFLMVRRLVAEYSAEEWAVIVAHSIGLAVPDLQWLGSDSAALRATSKAWAASQAEHIRVGATTGLEPASRSPAPQRRLLVSQTDYNSIAREFEPSWQAKEEPHLKRFFISDQRRSRILMGAPLASILGQRE